LPSPTSRSKASKRSERLVLVDSSCWIEYFHPRGSSEVKSVLREAIANDRVAVCGPVVCEVLRGAPMGEGRRLRQALESLAYLSQQDSDWSEVARILGELQSQGLQPPILDALISIVAKRCAGALWHFGDRHFGPIGRILRLDCVDLKAP
jgi:predicted nucleic acid-binding protein